MNEIDSQLMRKLRLFIEGRLGKKEAEEVKALLLESNELFNAYLELKEALFLKGHGSPATPEFEKKILDMVKNEKAPHFSFIVRFLKDNVIVTSGGQEKMDFQSVQASFSYRSENEAGAISINRQINGRNVTIILTPIKGTDEFSISVNIVKKEKLEAALIIEQKEIETIPDISKQKMFSSRIHSRGEVDLVFKKDDEILFTINLKLQSEK